MTMTRTLVTTISVLLIFCLCLGSLVVSATNDTYTLGDVNGDGNVNNKDVGQLQRFLNAWGISVNEAAADVNRDGNVNNKDIGVLQRHLSGWDTEMNSTAPTTTTTQREWSDWY